MAHGSAMADEGQSSQKTSIFDNRTNKVCHLINTGHGIVPHITPINAQEPMLILRLSNFQVCGFCGVHSSTFYASFEGDLKAEVVANRRVTLVSRRPGPLSRPCDV